MRNLTSAGRRTILAGSVLILTAAAVVATAGPAFATSVALTTNTIGGPSGGGNTITATVTTPTFTAGTPSSANVEFQWSTTGAATACSTTYSAAATVTSSAGIVQVTSSTNVTVPDTRTITILVPAGLALPTGTTTELFNICVYSGTTTGGSGSPLIADTSGGGLGYTIAPNKATLSAYQGPDHGGNTLTAVTSGGTLTSASGAEFQYAGADYCTAIYAAPSAPDGSTGIVAATPTLLNSTKVAVTVPSALVLVSQTTANYNLCLYDGTSTTSSVLISATALPYVIAAATTITAVTPGTGPAQGGTTLTVTGTNFSSSNMTVTLAGQVLTTVTVSGTTSFTATAPAHAAGGPYNLVITNLAGTVTKTAVFTYTNGITVSPTTSPNSSLSRTWLDVKGVGFNDLSFTATNGAPSNTNSTTAHVYLVRGTYNATPTTTGGPKTNPQSLECVDVVVVDDTEMICSLFLAGNQYSPTVTRTVTGCTATSGSPTLSGATGSTTCTFSSADVGMAVSGTGIAAGSMITAAPTSTSATLSKNTTGVTSTITVTITSNRTITDGTLALASGVTTLTSAAAPFGVGEIGHAVAAPGVLPTGTVITAVNGSAVATLSNAAIGTGTTMTIFTPYAVAVGTYTMTVVSNGAAGGNAATGYVQSIISSGSTFTIADYFR